jgi:hypothetical protein
LFASFLGASPVFALAGRFVCEAGAEVDDGEAAADGKVAVDGEVAVDALLPFVEAVSEALLHPATHNPKSVSIKNSRFMYWVSILVS